MKEIKSIHLGLENCEALKFEGKDILYIKHSEPVFMKEENHFVIKEFYISLLNKANVLKNYNDFFEGYYEQNEIVDRDLPFARLLKYKDIVNVEIEYIDGEKNNYYLDWYYNEEDEQNNQNYWQVENNLYQDSYLDRMVNILHISVDKNKRIEDYFRIL